MNVMPTLKTPRALRSQVGFTLVELMVTVAIALFLLGGLLTIVQNVRNTQTNQQLLAMLQDQQRFAMTVLGDVVQSGGYYPDPLNETPPQALPAQGGFPAGQAFIGTHAAGVTDTLGVRYKTALNDGIILCNGSTNTAFATNSYQNLFRVVQPAGNVPGQLQCSLDGGATYQTLVTGVIGLTVYYGVKRQVSNDYNVDTYVTADQMVVAGPNGNDWANISAVRIVLTFTNPMAGQPGQQPTITFDRVVEVMARAGVHT
jgi:type IV pilus assembly protein PilW